MAWSGVIEDAGSVAMTMLTGPQVGWAGGVKVGEPVMGRVA
jgi:hypothetical protein